MEGFVLNSVKQTTNAVEINLHFCWTLNNKSWRGKTIKARIIIMDGCWLIENLPWSTYSNNNDAAPQPQSSTGIKALTYACVGRTKMKMAHNK